MRRLIEILILLVFLLAGALVAGLRFAPKARLVERSISTIGLLGFTTATLTILGSCVAVALASTFMPALRFERSASPSALVHGQFQVGADRGARDTSRSALALSSGFGWYSLPGVLISNLGDPVLMPLFMRF